LLATLIEVQSVNKNIQLRLFTVISVVVLLAAVISGVTYIALNHSNSPVNPASFVKRSGSQLVLAGKPFRFAGANMHWLALSDSGTYVSQFRINDGLDAAKEMGATVIRAHSLGISVGCPNCIEPSLGTFNSTAFQHVDYAIKAAADHGMRLIIPLTDNYHYATGGKHTFTDWRGIPNEEEFYFNPQVIKDFETYISTLLNHVNVYTGVAYKDDPTIMAWETGNELVPPTIWTKVISTYIKNNDSHHLVMDGRVGIDPNVAGLSNVDIVSNHYYPMNIAKLTSDANEAKKIGKVFCIGEFDWNNANGGDALSSFLATIESNTSVSGDLYWELWSHNDQYGYASNQVQYTLHYPGDTDAMKSSAAMLRTHAYKMRNIGVPGNSAPGVPVMNTVIRGTQQNILVWRGAPLAANYTIERSSTGPNGAWTVICDKCVSDTGTPWTDTTVSGGALWYRVTAYNISGGAGSSTPPYQASASSTLDDNLHNWDKTFQHSNNLTFDTTNAQYTDGHTSVVVRTTTTHEQIIWKQDGMRSFQALSYFWPKEPVVNLSIYTSSDGKSWTLTKPSIISISGNWPEYVYTLNGLTKVNYVKMVWNNTKGMPWNPNLGSISISY